MRTGCTQILFAYALIVRLPRPATQGRNRTVSEMGIVVCAVFGFIDIVRLMFAKIAFKRFLHTEFLCLKTQALQIPCFFQSVFKLKNAHIRLMKEKCVFVHRINQFIIGQLL